MVTEKMRHRVTILTRCRVRFQEPVLSWRQREVQPPLEEDISAQLEGIRSDLILCQNCLSFQPLNAQVGNWYCAKFNAIKYCALSNFSGEVVCSRISSSIIIPLGEPDAIGRRRSFHYPL